jgi:methionyl aminopeptidase
MSENHLNSKQITDIKQCGKYLAEVMSIVVRNAKPGVVTKKLDDLAFSELMKRGCKPSFLDYEVKGAGSYPASLCISINDEIVHGLPSKSRFIKDEDVVSLDLGAEYKGVCTDMATTMVAGKSDKDKDKLLDTTKKSLELGIKAAKAGNKIGDIGAEIETYVLKNDFDVVRDYVGHGIGTQPHMWPQIPNFGKKDTGPTLTEGMALAIEPMVTVGSSVTKIHHDHWTVMTASGNLAAHFEHTIIIENGQPFIVTKA